jgi:hypothetical protein
LFWLEEGREMVKGSLPAVLEAAKSLITGLGLLQGLYIGIIGFQDFIPKTAPAAVKLLFTLPLAFRLAGLFFGPRVMMTEPRGLLLRSPDSIRNTLGEILPETKTAPPAAGLPDDGGGSDPGYAAIVVRRLKIPSTNSDLGIDRSLTVAALIKLESEPRVSKRPFIRGIIKPEFRRGE